MKQRVCLLLALAVSTLLAGRPAAAVPASAPVPRTGQTTVHYPDDDGAQAQGVVWPIPRFTDHGDGTVTDTLTGLMWSKNANPRSASTWTPALTFCNDYDAGGYDDWRMPNLRELLSVISYERTSPPLPDGHPFPGVPTFTYWTSTTSRDDPLRAWMVSAGATAIAFKDGGFSYYVWPVRGTRSLTTTAPVPVTGQTVSTAPGDDGALRQGVPFPGYRFIDNGDDTISDRLTGLMWSRNVNPFGGGVTWIAALESCGAWTFAGHTDWRLPNVLELQSLMDYAAAGRLPDGHPFTGYTTSRTFWSSTTVAGDTTRAHTLSMGALGAIRGELKNVSSASGVALWSWPVRGPVDLPPAPRGSGVLVIVR